MSTLLVAATLPFIQPGRFVEQTLVELSPLFWYCRVVNLVFFLLSG